MSKQDLLKTRTCVLRVNIDCEGCKNKVKRTLQKIDGVYAVAIDMQQGKVTVTGNVEPGVLIKKLEKSGKRAELCSSEKSKKSGFDENVNDQLKKLLQLGNGKGGGVDDVKKPQQKGGKEQQKSGAVNVSGDGKNLQQMKFQELLEQMKSGSKDFNMKGLQKPAAVKVESLPGKGVGHDFGDFSSGDDLDEDDDYGDDDEFDEDDDEFDDDEDEFDDDDEEEEEEEELDYGSDQNHKQQKTFMPIMSNDLGKDKKGGGGGEKAKKGGGGGGGDEKKSGGIMSMIGRAIGGNNEGKDGNLGKKGGGEGGGKSQGGGKKGGESKSSGGGGPKNGGEGKIGKKGGGGGGGKDVVVPNHTKGGGGGGGMGQMVQYPVGPMGPQFPATPIMNMNGGGGGYYQGSMGPVPGNPYQQQQYMAMMMNQQRMMNMNGGGGGAGMYHPAMFGRPPPGYGYVPPPAYNDHITNMFSDENPGSCSIM